MHNDKECSFLYSCWCKKGWFQTRKGVKRKADTTTPSSYNNDLAPDYGDHSFEPEKLNAHGAHPTPARRESVRQIKKPKRELEEPGTPVSTMVNSHLLPPSEVNWSYKNLHVCCMSSKCPLHSSAVPSLLYFYTSWESGFLSTYGEQVLWYLFSAQAYIACGFGHLCKCSLYILELEDMFSISCKSWILSYWNKSLLRFLHSVISCIVIVWVWKYRVVCVCLSLCPHSLVSCFLSLQNSSNWAHALNFPHYKKDIS